MVLGWRLLANLLIVSLGYLTALTFGLRGIDSTSGYFVLATTLLAVGLFSSTYDIALGDMWRDVRLVMVAVTVGVLFKAALIAGVMYYLFQEPAYIVLGVAVAQIDPLSVAVMRHGSRLSARARTILSAWSSFDDPVTAVLAIYLSTVALHMGNARTAEGSQVFDVSGATSVAGGLFAFGQGLLGNLLLVIAAVAVWIPLWWAGKRTRRPITDGDRPKTGLQAIAVLTLLAAATVAVYNFLMLGLAAMGLFFRPALGSVLKHATRVAFLLATFVLGIVLADGADFLPGLVLGCAAFGAQVVVGVVVTRSLPRADRIRLALGQQSGITAVVLALLLETVFPGTVAIVAPAILVVNVFHLVANTLFDRIEDRAERAGRAPSGEPGGDARPSAEHEEDVSDGRRSAPGALHPADKAYESPSLTRGRRVRRRRASCQ